MIITCIAVMAFTGEISAQQIQRIDTMKTVLHPVPYTAFAPQKVAEEPSSVSSVPSL